MKEAVQDMRKSSSKRERRTVASERAPGFSLFGDNIGFKLILNTRTNLKYFYTGKVINQRHNTGLDHKGHYLNMAQIIAIENRIPSAHYR